MRPISELLLPPVGLASCVFAGIYRDTRGTSLPDRDRINHFPASPIVAVSKVFHGDLFLLSSASDLPSHDSLTRVPSLSVTGPQDVPISSWSPGPETALTVGFYYDAWLQLGGDAQFTEIPAAVAEAFAQFDIDAPRQPEWDRFATKLADVWASKAGPKETRRITGVSDWAQAIVTRGALSTAGRSLRSLQRFIKRESGHTQRTLDVFSTLENVHRQQAKGSQTSLAEFAIDAGFSDQSHMGRAVRRLTGFSPAQLNRAIAEDEPFWCYRLLGERF